MRNTEGRGRGKKAGWRLSQIYPTSGEGMEIYLQMLEASELPIKFQAAAAWPKAYTQERGTERDPSFLLPEWTAPSHLSGWRNRLLLSQLWEAE